jgi:hypothetical protein
MVYAVGAAPDTKVGDKFEIRPPLVHEAIAANEITGTFGFTTVKVAEMVPPL